MKRGARPDIDFLSNKVSESDVYQFMEPYD